MYRINPINTELITEGERSLKGKGAFDFFMRAVKEHILEEYTSGRITGDLYAQAYISVINNALQVAAQFVPAMVTTNNGLDLIKSQLLQADAQLKQAEAVLKQTTAQTEQIEVLTKQAIEKIEATKQEVILLKGQTDLVKQQKLTEEAQINSNPGGQHISGKIGSDIDVAKANIDAYKVKQIQDATKLLTDSWTSRLAIVTESTSANKHNMLHDNQIGSAVRTLCSRVRIPIARMGVNNPEQECTVDDSDNPEITGAETGPSDT